VQAAWPDACAVFVRDTVELPAVVAELEAAVVCMEGTA